MRKKYINISLPLELVEGIDIVVQKNGLGYKNRAEFTKEAIRIHLRYVSQYNQLKKESEEDEKEREIFLTKRRNRRFLD
ncbi:MAG: ribbon-helix-helix domain-containing protein [Nanoarchaeota archaeon]